MSWRLSIPAQTLAPTSVYSGPDLGGQPTTAQDDWKQETYSPSSKDTASGTSAATLLISMFLSLWNSPWWLPSCYEGNMLEGKGVGAWTKTINRGVPGGPVLREAPALPTDTTILALS